MGGEVATDFKSSNRIEISWLVQVLLNFDWFRECPRGVRGWVDGGERWWEGASHTCTHAHAHLHTHACACTYDIIGNSQGFPQWGLPFAIEIIMFNMYMCVCACAHVWGALPNPIHPPPTPKEPQGAQIRKITITLERIKIIQFCLKICDPWTPLQTYRLGLMCRLGVSYPQWHFYVFDPKKCSCDSPIKKFPIFALDPIRPYLHWNMRGFLTS